MRQWLFGISVLCLSLSSAIQPVSAQTPQTVKGETIVLAQASPQDAKLAIAQLYQAMDDALNRRDLKRYGSFMAPEYTVTGLDKTVRNRQQMLQTTAENFQVLRQLKIQTQLKQIKVDGKTATVTGVMNFRGIATNPDNAQETRTVVGQQSFQEVVQLAGQQWKVLTARTLSQKTQVEPKPNQQTSDRNYDQVMAMGASAASGCYQSARLNDCAKFDRIQAKLSTLCATDQQACRILTDLTLYANTLQLGK
jgi:ketosteroid isomerase-like protein